MARVSHLGRVVAAAAVLLGIGTAAVNAAGAIAIGACGAYGYAYDRPNFVQAEAAALRRCGARDCRLVATVRRGCAAFAVDAKDLCGAHGYAVAPRLARAQNAALKQCYTHGGKDCVVRAFACDARH